ncbi:MAG: ribosome assembly cofactor RimP [Spirochaetes bacterium]|nr:MAG: ribosome assembly cofactor RimP [Spirochaetota bacterium]
MGFSIVEIRSRQLREKFFVGLTIYRNEGVTIENCTEVYHTVLPKIELAENTRDVHLEVSSPGIDRVLKNSDEFSIFTGRKVKMLVEGSNEWVRGIIKETDEDRVMLQIEDKIAGFTYDSIRKAQLE